MADKDKNNLTGVSTEDLKAELQRRANESLGGTLYLFEHDGRRWLEFNPTGINKQWSVLSVVKARVVNGTIQVEKSY